MRPNFAKYQATNSERIGSGPDTLSRSGCAEDFFSCPKPKNKANAEMSALWVHTDNDRDGLYDRQSEHRKEKNGAN